jgi:SmpA/OmlA family protein
MAETKAAHRWTILRIAKYIGIITGTLLLALLILAAVFFWWIHRGVFTVSRFDPTVWFASQTNETDSTCYRGGMAADIKDRLLKPGMTYQEVERLLGKPDGHSTPKEYQYILGMCSGFRMDYDTLHVYFNVDGKYERAAIIQH